jgi:hypothetical protein
MVTVAGALAIAGVAWPRQVKSAGVPELPPLPEPLPLLETPVVPPPLLPEPLVEAPDEPEVLVLAPLLPPIDPDELVEVPLSLLEQPATITAANATAKNLLRMNSPKEARKAPRARIKPERGRGHNR